MKFRNCLKWTLLGHLLAVSSPAATVVWNGMGANANWSVPTNWGGVTAANGDSLVFSGTTRQTNSNNILTSVGAVDFTNGGFNIGGNAVTLNGDLTSAGNNTWGINTTVTGARTFTIHSGILTFTGSLNNGGNNITITGAGNASLSGSISGAGGLFKTGTGILTLTGINTYSGTTRISDGGIVAITADNQLGAAPVIPTVPGIVLDGGTLSTAGSFTLNANRGIGVGPASGQGDGTLNVVSGELTYNGVVSDNAVGGTGNLVKTGSGTLTLGGANTYSGNTVVSAGTLKLGSSSAVPSGAGKGNVSISANGILDLGSNSASVNGLSGAGIVSSSAVGSRTFTVGLNNQSSSFGGVIQNGAGFVSLFKTGSGVLTLGGANIYSGTTTVSGGTIRIGNVAAIPVGVGAGNVVVDGTLDLNGTSVAINGLSGGGTILNNSSTAATLSVGTSDQSGIFTGAIADGISPAGVTSLTKIGLGVLTLTGSSTYTGGTWIKTGYITLGGGNDRLPTATVLTLGEGIVSGILKLDGRSQTVAGIVTSGLGLGSNRVINGNAMASTFTVNNSANYDYNGTFGGTGTNENNFSLAKTGIGTLTLSTGNTFTGGLSISGGGTVKVNNTGALNSSTPNNVTFAGTAAGSKLQLNGFNTTIGNLTATSDAPVIENGSASGAILTVNQTANTTYAGTFANGTGGGALGIIKAGTGTLTLAPGSVNTHSGGTAINGGTLSINSDANLGAVPGSPTPNNIYLNGGRLNINTSMTLNSNRGIALGPGVGVGPGTIDVSAARTLAYGGIIANNSLGNGTLVKSGRGTFNLSSTANTYTGGTTVAEGLLNVTSTTGTPLGANALGNNISVSGGANLSLTSTSNKGGLQTITVNSAAGSLGGIGFSNTSLTQAQLAGMFTDSTGTFGGVLSINNGITYATALNLSTFRNGSWFLGSASTGTYSPATLAVGSGNRYRLGGGGGSLTFNGSNVLTGTAAVQVGFSGTNGNGTVVVNTTQDYSGGTSILGGTYSIGLDRALGAAPASPAAGNVVINGGALSANTTFTLNANRGIALGPATGSGGGTLDVTANQRLSYGGSIVNNGTGTGSLVKTGSGTLTLSGNCTYTGSTTVSAGSLYVNGAIGSAPASVASGATLGGSGNIGGTVSVAGTLSPGQENQIGSIGLNSLDLSNNLLIQWDGSTNFIDRVDVTNLMQIQAGSSLTFSGLGGTLTQNAYVFASYGSLSPANNLFSTINNLPSNYHIVYDYGPQKNQIALVIPEPSAAAPGLIGILLLLFRRSRNRSTR